MTRAKRTSLKTAPLHATVSAIINQVYTFARLCDCSDAAASLNQDDGEKVIDLMRERAERKLDAILDQVLEQGDLAVLDALPRAADETLDDLGCRIIKHAVQKRCISRVLDDDQKVITNYYFPVILPVTEGEARLTEASGRLLEAAWADLDATRMERAVVNPRLLPLEEFSSMPYSQMVTSLYADHAALQAWADDAMPTFEKLEGKFQTSMYVIEFQVTTDVARLQTFLSGVAEEMRADDDDEDGEDDEDEDDDDEQGDARAEFLAAMATAINGVLSQQYGVPVLGGRPGTVFEAFAGAVLLHEMLCVNTDLTQQLTERGFLDQEVSFHATLHGHAAGNPTQGSVEQIRISLTDGNGSIVATHIVDLRELPDPSGATEMVQGLALRFKGAPRFDDRIHHICEDVHTPRFFTGSEWVVPSALLMSRPVGRTLH